MTTNGATNGEVPEPSGDAVDCAPISDPALSKDASRRKPKKAELTFAILGCSLVFVIAVFFGLSWISSQVLSRLQFAQTVKVGMDIESLLSAVDRYAVNNAGAYPATLEVLVVPDEKGETYLKGQRQLPLDPWGNDYVYFAPGEGAQPRIVSYGRDGKPGGEGEDADIDSTKLKRD